MPATGLAVSLAASLPDSPRFVETRAMLGCATAVVSGGRSPHDGFVVRVLEGARSALAVVGRPDADLIVRATAGMTDMTPLVAQADNAGHVGRALEQAPSPWQHERVVIHVAAGHPPLPPLPAGADVRLVRPDDPLEHLPPGLGHEMRHARLIAPVAGVFVGGLGVSFCYPCWMTESWWDVSVDTLEEHRGRALAGHAARFMEDHMRRQQRAPVWGAVESNAASLRLAARLGYQAVDETVVFSRGGWAFLTAGFAG